MENITESTKYKLEKEKRYRVILRAARVSYMISQYFEKLLFFILVLFMVYTAQYNDFFPNNGEIAFIFGGIVSLIMLYFLKFTTNEIKILKNIENYIQPPIYLTGEWYEDKDGQLWKVKEIGIVWKQHSGGTYTLIKDENDGESHFFYEKDLFFKMELDPTKIVKIEEIPCLKD